MNEANTLNIHSAQEGLEFLKQNGYVIFENVLSDEDLQKFSSAYDDIMAYERDHPFDPGDGPPSADDEAMAKYLVGAYKIDDDELARVMKRIRHTRAENHDTPWPVSAEKVSHSFLQMPLVSKGGSQRSYNLPAKLAACDRLMEHPIILKLMGNLLEEDFVISDFSANSIAPQSGTSYWHIDSPFTMVPEPVPKMPLAIQVGWLIDDFKVENGSTVVVPGTHTSGKKPPWTYDSLEDEVALTGPAGSLVFWFSQVWHRAGNNTTDRPRRAILGNYIRSWIKPLSDFTRSIPTEVLQSYSPRLRYLLGWSAFGPRRG